MESLYLILLTLLLAVTTSADPLVTLNHGGQLRGKSFDYGGVSMELFLGIRYADAPVGVLRFQKPKPPRPWSGIKDVNTTSNVCPQLSYTGAGGMIGEEDCLFMDITVPGGVDATNKRPVMMFIHGGGYTIGSKDVYLGAPLAKHGDVIVVTINYRLDALGFLSDGPGTGNFGLWDQRAALLWIQDNIAKFGGDPELVTIFGESAGAGSVSALALGQYTGGLFKRAIQESGSLYTEWGWYLSERERCDLVNTIKKQANCPSTDSVYECLRELSVEEIFQSTPRYMFFKGIWHPTPDNDFFPSEVLNEGYELSKRFDLLAGFNGQEGGLFLLSPPLYNMIHESLEGGLSESYVQLRIENDCKVIAPLSVDLCKGLYSKEYGLNTTVDDEERARRLSYALGERNFNVDVLRHLISHSDSDKSTYAYHFIENFSSSAPIDPGMPLWFKVSAFHVDEIPFVFGYIYINENDIWREYFGPELTEEAALIYPYLNNTIPSNKPLTDLMMTMWTNFAITGDPNSPVSLPANIPGWPEFNPLSNQFMELNSTNTGLITTPHKDRLDKLINTLLPLRNDQHIADQECTNHGEVGKDAVIG